MMYYRRKLILALLKELGGDLTQTQLQKYLFLVTRKQINKSFDFVPYLYGCFSFRANQDILTLSKLGHLSQRRNRIFLEDSHNYYSELSRFDQIILNNLTDSFGKAPINEIIKYIYINYPFYAINSTIASNVLNRKDLERVESQRKHYDELKLFTIGYEGKSVEKFLDILITHDVRVLCDVRRNAISQKYGFSKAQLEKFCGGLNIRYIHFPELGIESNLRQKLSSQRDYDELFDFYEENTLPKRSDCLLRLRNLISQEGRIALTCFEQNPKQCHRSRVARAILNTGNVDYSFENIL